MTVFLDIPELKRTTIVADKVTLINRKHFHQVVLGPRRARIRNGKPVFSSGDRIVFPARVNIFTADSDNPITINYRSNAQANRRYEEIRRQLEEILESQANNA